MDSGLSGLIGALIGAGSAIGVGLINNAHERKLQRQHVHRERLEELYSLLGEWEHQNSYSNFQLSLVLSGQADTQQYKEAMSSIEKLADFNRIVMIVGIYGHAFQSVFQELIEARNDLTTTVKQGLDEYIKTTPNKAFPKQVLSKQPRLTKAIEDLKSEIVKAAKEV